MNGNGNPGRLAELLISKLGERAPLEAAELVGQTFDAGKASTSNILGDVLAAIEDLGRFKGERK